MAGSPEALVTVQVVPRSRPSVEVTDDGIVLRVSAPPVDGRATEEARRSLAEALGVPHSAVTLRTGRRARTKVFAVRGLSPDEVGARLGRR
jgi:uncharacterized protein YggU (UPF0235/DUF167 family)